MIKETKKIRINSLPDLSIEMSSLSNNWCFRGQAHDWPIKSSFDRCLDFIRQSNNNPLLLNENQNICLEMWILNHFLNSNENYLKKIGIEVGLNKENFIKIHALQQHYGFPTRLTDWTLNWKIALYFCIEDDTQTEDMVLWALNKKSIPDVNAVLTDERYLFPSIMFEDNIINSYYNRLREGIYLINVPFFERIKAQEGILLLSGHADDMIFEEHIYESSCLNAGIFKKFIISKELRKAIQLFLEQNGINKEILYPKELLEMNYFDKTSLFSFTNKLYPSIK